MLPIWNPRTSQLGLAICGPFDSDALQILSPTAYGRYGSESRRAAPPFNGFTQFVLLQRHELGVQVCRRLSHLMWPALRPGKVDGASPENYLLVRQPWTLALSARAWTFHNAAAVNGSDSSALRPSVGLNTSRHIGYTHQQT